jgi:hypothetical protein
MKLVSRAEDRLLQCFRNWDRFHSRPHKCSLSCTQSHERSGLRLRKDRGGFLCISHAPHKATTQGFIAGGVRASQCANEGATIVQAQGTRGRSAICRIPHTRRASQCPGLARWTILMGSHKASGISASTINRMLAAPQLPPLARSKIREYVEDKGRRLIRRQQRPMTHLCRSSVD